MTPARSFPSLSPTGERRLARLADARIHVVCGTRRREGDLAQLLTVLCDASVDLVRLRDETATEDELRFAADVFRRVCDRSGALFVLSGYPGLALQVGADGVHLDRVDVHPDHARTVCGPDLLIGRTVRSSADLDAAADEDIDHVALGPVLAPADGFAPVGLELVRYAARHAAHPWAAGGGITPDTVEQVLEAGARRIVVTRTVTEAEDPAAVVWALRRAIARYHS